LLKDIFLGEKLLNFSLRLLRALLILLRYYLFDTIYHLYHGVPVSLGRKAQRDKCVASFKRSLLHLRWKLHKVDLDIKVIRTCVLARSILSYTVTPMVAAGLWKRMDIYPIKN
jgi:hypothetical protein